VSTFSLVLRRLRNDWRLMLSVFLGILVATTLISGAPVYLSALERQSIIVSIDSAVNRSSEAYLSIITEARFVPAEEEALQANDEIHAEAMARNVAEVHVGTQRHVKTAAQLAALPAKPVTDRPETAVRVVEGFFQSYSDIARHIVFFEGRMATDVVLRGTQGPMLEGVVSAELALEYDDLTAGDVVIVTPSIESPARISVRIVGIMSPTDPSDEFWQGDANAFVNPRVPDPEGGDPEDQPLLLGIFVSQQALIEAMSDAYPGAVVDTTWYGAVDSGLLKGRTTSEIGAMMDELKEELSLSIPGSTLRSGINILLVGFERQSFLSSVPLLVLMAVLGVTTIYFLFMIVSYLVPIRESDIALFRSRGTSLGMVAVLYTAEGILLTLGATAVAPFLALGGVAATGFLPYFEHITGGGALPVDLSWTPFVTAFAAGALCFAVFVAPGVLGARASLIVGRLRSSRPPSTPFVQRYFIDVGLLAAGGVLFWELQARGQLISGGLFDQPDVNEALLAAPVLFLLVVGLMFFRVFPLFVRFVSGESPALAHIAVSATLAALGPAIAIRDIRAGDRTGWLPEAALLVALAGVYVVTARARSWKARAALMAIQAVVIGLFLSREFPDADQSVVIIGATIALTLVVPAQIVFQMLRAFARSAPAWVSITMWRMARNPLQYTWLVLLLVLVSGVGILSTTVGASLDQSYEERVLYEAASDIRVHNLPVFVSLDEKSIKAEFGAIPGVESLTVAARGRGKIGASDQGRGFAYMALEPDLFDSWFRDDFAAKPLGQILDSLTGPMPIKPLPLPEETTELRVWVNTGGYYPLIFLWVVVEDANGRSRTLTMGQLGVPGWNLMTTETPPRMAQPLKIVSIQLNEPGFGATATVGTAVFDDLHAYIGSTGEEVALEGFESELDWAPLVTSGIDSDEITLVSDNVHGGSQAAMFSFGKETNLGLRGFFRTDGDGILPVVASRTFAEAAETPIGSQTIVSLTGGLVPVIIRDTVEYFPTLDPAGAGFLLFDLDGMLSYTGALNPMASAAVNEFYVATEDGSDEAVHQAIREKNRNWGSILDAEAELESLRLDPLISAGWQAMALAAVGVILFTAGLGYVVYLLAFADAAAAEMASLRSQGLSGSQTLALMALEHLLVAFIGIGVGAWAGFQMSRMMVSSVAITDSGGRVLPPFLLNTDWTIMGAAYVAMIAIFVVSILTVGRRMVSVDLRRLSRMEG
jgi:hypothetical protein